MLIFPKVRQRVREAQQVDPPRAKKVRIENFSSPFPLLKRNRTSRGAFQGEALFPAEKTSSGALLLTVLRRRLSDSVFRGEAIFLPCQE